LPSENSKFDSQTGPIVRRATPTDLPRIGRLGTLKTELVHHRRYGTREEAESEIGEYIDLFYNRQRRQARLGYLSPAAYTQQFTRRQRAA
jgi:transposase InsO family protein